MKALKGVLFSNRIEIFSSSHNNVPSLREKLGEQAFVSFRKGVIKIKPKNNTDIIDLALSLGESCCKEETIVKVPIPETSID